MPLCGADPLARADLKDDGCGGCHGNVSDSALESFRLMQVMTMMMMMMMMMMVVVVVVVVLLLLLLAAMMLVLVL